MYLEKLSQYSQEKKNAPNDIVGVEKDAVLIHQIVMNVLLRIAEIDRKRSMLINLHDFLQKMIRNMNCKFVINMQAHLDRR